jgi:hypothetical protein
LTEDFWFWLLLLGVAVVGGGRLAFRWLHIARVIEDTPTSRVRSAAQGYVELSGRGRPLGEAPTPAPLTGRPCIWWHFRIQKRTESRVNGRKRVSWKTIQAGRSEQPFLLDDETGQCIVKPAGAEVLTGESTTWYGGAPWPSGIQAGSGRRHGGHYRYFEERIYEHEIVYVLGQFHSHSSAGQDDSGEQVRRLLEQWKKDQQGLVDRFDRDRDGQVSVKEWELARAEAVQEIQQRRLERPAQPMLHSLGPPPDGRLFLIAAFPGSDIARRYRRKAMLAFAGFVLATYALGWTLQAVFG